MGCCHVGQRLDNSYVNGLFTELIVRVLGAQDGNPLTVDEFFDVLEPFVRQVNQLQQYYKKFGM